MLRQLVELSLRKRGVIITLAAALICCGVLVTMRSKLDVFPDFVPAQAEIQTEAPGLAADQVEVGAGPQPGTL